MYINILYTSNHTNNISIITRILIYMCMCVCINIYKYSSNKRDTLVKLFA